MENKGRSTLSTFTVKFCRLAKLQPTFVTALSFTRAYSYSYWLVLSMLMATAGMFSFGMWTGADLPFLSAFTAKATPNWGITWVAEWNQPHRKLIRHLAFPHCKVKYSPFFWKYNYTILRFSQDNYSEPETTVSGCCGPVGREWLFFKIDPCSTISFKWFWQELSIHVAEHRCMLKNKRVVRILFFFEDTPVQPYYSKGLRESFSFMWLNVGISWKIRE